MSASTTNADTSSNRLRLRVQLLKFLPKVLSVPLPRHPLPPPFFTLLQHCFDHFDREYGARAWAADELVSEFVREPLEGVIADGCLEIESLLEDTAAAATARTGEAKQADGTVAPADAASMISGASHTSRRSPAVGPAQPAPEEAAVDDSELTRESPSASFSCTVSDKVMPSLESLGARSPSSSPPPLEADPRLAPQPDTASIADYNLKNLLDMTNSHGEGARQDAADCTRMASMPPAALPLPPVLSLAPLLPARCVLLHQGAVSGTHDAGPDVSELPLSASERDQAVWLGLRWGPRLMEEVGQTGGGIKSETEFRQEVASRVLMELARLQLLWEHERQQLLWMCCQKAASVCVLFFASHPAAAAVRTRLASPLALAAGVSCHFDSSHLPSLLPPILPASLPLPPLPSSASSATASPAASPTLMRGGSASSCNTNGSSSGFSERALAQDTLTHDAHVTTYSAVSLALPPPPLPLPMFSLLPPIDWCVSVHEGQPVGAHPSGGTRLDDVLSQGHMRDRSAQFKSLLVKFAHAECVSAASPPLALASAVLSKLEERRCLSVEMRRSLEWLRLMPGLDECVLLFATADMAAAFVSHVHSLPPSCGIFKVGHFPHAVARGSAMMRRHSGSSNTAAAAAAAAADASPTPALAARPLQRIISKSASPHRPPHSYQFRFNLPLDPGLNVAADGNAEGQLCVIQSVTDRQELIRHRLVLSVPLGASGRPTTDADMRMLLRGIVDELQRRRLIQHSSGQLMWIAPFAPAAWTSPAASAASHPELHLCAQVTPGTKSCRIILNSLRHSPELSWRLQPFVAGLLEQCQEADDTSGPRICIPAFTLLGDEKEAACTRHRCALSHNCEAVDELFQRRQQRREMEIRQRQQLQRDAALQTRHADPHDGQQTRNSRDRSRSRSRSRERDSIRDLAGASVKAEPH